MFVDEVESVPELVPVEAESVAYAQLDASSARGTPGVSETTDGARRCGGTAGLIFMALSAVSFSIMTMLVHVLASRARIPSFEQVVFRCILGIGLSALWTRWASASLWPARRATRCLLTARALVGMVGMSGNWFIVTQLSLGDATVIIFTAPIFTALLARVFLKEKLSSPQMGLLCVSVVGVMLVARPSFLGFEGDPTPAYASMARGPVVVIGLVAAVASAATNILVRKLLDVHAMTTVTWLMAAGLLVQTPLTFALQTPRWPEGIGNWTIVVCIGLLGFAGQGFKTQGLKWEKAGPGSMMRNLDLVLAFIFQITILGEEVKALSVVGAVLTLSASVSMGLLKLRARPTSPSSSSGAVLGGGGDGDAGPDRVGVAVEGQSEGGLIELGVTLSKRRGPPTVVVGNQEIDVALLGGGGGGGNFGARVGGGDAGAGFD